MKTAAVSHKHTLSESWYIEWRNMRFSCQKMNKNYVCFVCERIVCVIINYALLSALFSLNIMKLD